LGNRYIKATHAFDGQERIIKIQLRAPRNAIGTYRRQVDGFRTVSKAWDSTTTANATQSNGVWDPFPANTSGLSETAAPCTCVDPRDSKVYHVNKRMAAILNPLIPFGQPQWEICLFGSSPAKYQVLASFNGWQFRGTCIDTTRDRWVCIINRPAATLEYLPLAGGALVALEVTGLTTTDPFISQYNGLCYDGDNDRYVLQLSPEVTASGLDEFWAVDPVTAVATYLGTSGTVNTTGGLAGFEFVPSLGGIFYAPDCNQPIWCIPTRQNP